MYMYIHIYICEYIYMYVYLHTYVCACTYMRINKQIIHTYLNQPYHHHYQRVTKKGGPTGQKSVLKIVGNSDKSVLGMYINE
jgi:hypothetical protein